MHAPNEMEPWPLPEVSPGQGQPLIMLKVTGQVSNGRPAVDHVVGGIYSSLRVSASQVIPASSTWMRSWFERAPTKIE